MPKRISKFHKPLDARSFGLLFAGEGDTGGGGSSNTDTATSTGDQGGDGKGVKPAGTDKGATDTTGAGKTDTDVTEKLEGQKRVNRDLETKLNQMRDGLKAALGVDDKKASVEDLISSLKDEIGGLRRENLVEKVARRHNITSDDDLALLQSATDSAAMEKLAARIAPKGDDKDATDASGKPGSKPKPDSSQGRGGGGSEPKGSLASGRDLYAERHKKKSTTSP